MDNKLRYQSCGMPLGTPGGYGTNADGTENLEYCKFDFQNGAFTEPDLTVNQMVEKSVKFMVGELKFEEAKAREMSQAIIPNLKRWKNH